MKLPGTLDKYGGPKSYSMLMFSLRSLPETLSQSSNNLMAASLKYEFSQSVHDSLQLHASKLLKNGKDKKEREEIILKISKKSMEFAVEMFFEMFYGW